MKFKKVVIKPVITEKAASLAQKNKYIFKVSKSANKKMIAADIKKYYKVDPLKINIIKIAGKKKLIQGRFKSQTSPIKKAVVLLKKGQKIEGFEE